MTRELVNIDPAALATAPIFPSLLEEGQPGGGYDVALDFGTFWFLQFKLSEYMVRNTAGQSGVIATPYYRFWLMPAWRSAQHAMLLDLQGSGENVYYVAPHFWLQTEFNEAFADTEVALRSVFIPPGDIGPLSDEDHCVVWNDGAMWALSEPKPIRAFRGSEFLEKLSESLHGGGPRVAAVREVAITMQGIVRKHGFSSPEFGSFEGPKRVLEYISFLAHVFFHSEMIFIPRPNHPGPRPRSGIPRT